MEVLTKAKKWTIFKGVCPWIFSKNQTFFYRRFTQNFCQKRSFFDILNRKELFLEPEI